MRFSPDGRTLAIWTDDSVILWEVAARQARTRLEARLFGEFAFTPDGKSLVTAGEGSPLRLWDLPTGKPRVLSVQAERVTKRIHSMALSPDGKTLAIGDDKGAVRLWDMAAVKELETLHGKERISHLAFSPDGNTLAAIGSPDGEPRVGSVWLWDVTKRRLRTTHEREEPSMCLAFSPDSQTLAVGHGATVRLCDPTTGRLRASLKVGWFSPPMALVFSPDGRVLAVAGGELEIHGFSKASGEVKFWDVTAQKEIQTLRVHEECVYWMALSPDGKLLAVSTGKRSSPMKLWDVSSITGRPPGKPPAASVRPRADPVHQRAVPAGNLTPAELEKLWSDLAGTDAPRAYQAIWALAGAPQQAVAFLAKQLRPAARPALLDQAGQFLADLGSDVFAVREKATQALEELGELALPALRRALADRPSLEARQRIELLLEKQDKAALPPERLRALRAVEALEYIGSPAAWQLLEALAQGAPEVCVTQEAILSLERLSKRLAAP